MITSEYIFIRRTVIPMSRAKKLTFAIFRLSCFLFFFNFEYDYSGRAHTRRSYRPLTRFNGISGQTRSAKLPSGNVRLPRGGWERLFSGARECVDSQVNRKFSVSSASRVIRIEFMHTTRGQVMTSICLCPSVCAYVCVCVSFCRGPRNCPNLCEEKRYV